MCGVRWGVIQIVSFRFRRRFKILPGIHLNVSRGGLSLSAGVRGAHVTASAKQIFIGAGLPGTGVSWLARIWSRRSNPQNEEDHDAQETDSQSGARSAP